MIEIEISHIMAESETTYQINIALLFGLVLLGGTFGSRLVQKFHVPQVVGCIIVGIVLGDVLGLINAERIESLEPFTMFALGVIGFMIGGELRADVFKKYGKQFFYILFAQGFGAFILVAAATFLAGTLLPGVDAKTSMAMGLVFGAIASATAPAATVNVLWEYKTRGPLTVAVLAIVALDDALALLLYRGASTGAQALIGTRHDSVLATTFALFSEIIGAILLGFFAGLMLFYLLKLVKADDKILEFALASLLLIVGISMIPGIDPILPAMTLGITMANLAPRQSKAVFELVKKFAPPIYVCFFVLAGAHMEFAHLSGMIIVMIVVFTVFRAVGKILGSWYGAKHTHAPKAVQKYLGICLLPQAGVAIGLAILAGQQFSSQTGKTIIMVVMTATFIMEVLGPMLVKTGVKKAGEVGMNVTEEDLIDIYKVSDVMDTETPVIHAGASLSEVVSIFSNTSSVYYSVVDNENNLIGAITLSGIRNTFTTQELNDWLVALDIVEPVIARINSQIHLSEAFEMADKYDVDHLPIIEANDSDKYIGLLDCRAVHRSLSAEVLSRQQKADSIQNIEYA